MRPRRVDTYKHSYVVAPLIMERYTKEQQQQIKDHLDVPAAALIVTKAMAHPQRPVPMYYARTRLRNLQPPPAAFRNWGKMLEWYKNS